LTPEPDALFDRWVASLRVAKVVTGAEVVASRCQDDHADLVIMTGPPDRAVELVGHDDALGVTLFRPVKRDARNLGGGDLVLYLLGRDARLGNLLSGHLNSLLFTEQAGTDRSQCYLPSGRMLKQESRSPILRPASALPRPARRTRVSGVSAPDSRPKFTACAKPLDPLVSQSRAPSLA
jgi:hypothetical protein